MTPMDDGHHGGRGDARRLPLLAGAGAVVLVLALWTLPQLAPLWVAVAVACGLVVPLVASSRPALLRGRPQAGPSLPATLRGAGRERGKRLVALLDRFRRAAATFGPAERPLLDEAERRLERGLEEALHLILRWQEVEALDAGDPRLLRERIVEMERRLEGVVDAKMRRDAERSREMLEERIARMESAAGRSDRIRGLLDVHELRLEKLVDAVTRLGGDLLETEAEELVALEAELDDMAEDLIEEGQGLRALTGGVDGQR